MRLAVKPGKFSRISAVMRFAASKRCALRIDL